MSFGVWLSLSSVSKVIHDVASLCQYLIPCVSGVLLPSATSFQPPGPPGPGAVDNSLLSKCSLHGASSVASSDLER